MVWRCPARVQGWYVFRPDGGVQHVLCPSDGDWINGEHWCRGGGVAAHVSHFELACLDAPSEAWFQLYGHLGYSSFSDSVTNFPCSSHGLRGVVSNHSTNPTGIMSIIDVSTILPYGFGWALVGIKKNLSSKFFDQILTATSSFCNTSLTRH